MTLSSAQRAEPFEHLQSSAQSANRAIERV